MRKVLLSLLSMASVLCYAQTNEIKEVEKKRELATYEIHVAPNPSPNHVVVSAPEGAICEVVSMKGTYVGTWEIRGEGLRLEELGQGVYVANILYEGQRVTRRFVIL